MVQPMVSIIVPIYNVKKYIGNCIESLLKQTYREVQIILVDDGSTDGSSSICDMYGSLDTRVKVIHQKNRGLPGARNTGMQYANGEWIFFVDSDDWLAYDTIECVISAVNNDVDFLMFEYQRMQEFEAIVEAKGNGRIIELNKEDMNLILRDVVSPSHRHCKKISANSVVAWNKVYRREFLLEHNILFDEDVKIHEDVPFATKIFMYATNGLYLDKKFYQYRYNDNSIMNGYKRDYVKRIEPLVKKMEELLLLEFDNKELGLQLYNERLCILVAQCMERFFCNPKNNEKYRVRRSAWKKILSNSQIASSMKNVNLNEFTLKKQIIVLCIKFKIFLIPDLYFHWIGKKN